MVDMEVFSSMLQDINDRSGGDYKNMTLTDRLTTISIMRELKNQIEEIINEYYPIICEWSKLDVREEILKVKEPDLNSLERFFDVRNYRYNVM